jgi:Icc-related predicted phosphoesterase
MVSTDRVVRVAAMADLHCGIHSREVLEPLLDEAVQGADVLLLGGDLTDHGDLHEAETLVSMLATLPVPIVAVLGNHDAHKGQEQGIKRLLLQAGVHLLDGHGFEINGVGIAGVRGAGGGFAEMSAEPWGEDYLRQLQPEADSEADKLEDALASLTTPHRIVLLHYSPIRDTLLGEPLELYALLGCDQLAQTIRRHPVLAVFHGHAHQGALEGHTPEGVPVYNVALPLMRKMCWKHPPWRLLEIPVPEGEG